MLKTYNVAIWIHQFLHLKLTSCWAISPPKSWVIAHFLDLNLPYNAHNTHLRQGKKWKWSLMYVFMYTCDRFHLFLTGWFEVNNLVNFLISILISHFSRTHSVSRSPSKLHWNLIERFFLDVHLAFTCAPASVHLTRKNAYAVVE